MRIDRHTQNDELIRFLDRFDGEVLEPALIDDQECYCVTLFHSEPAYGSSIFDVVEQKTYLFPDYFSAISFLAALGAEDGEYMLHRVEAFDEAEYKNAETDIWALNN